jgi:hypothetical protein
MSTFFAGTVRPVMSILIFKKYFIGIFSKKFKKIFKKRALGYCISFCLGVSFKYENEARR